MSFSQFEGCAFVFTPFGARPVESPYCLRRWDNFESGVDLAEVVCAMHMACDRHKIRDASTRRDAEKIVPFDKWWREERRKALSKTQLCASPFRLMGYCE